MKPYSQAASISGISLYLDDFAPLTMVLDLLGKHHRDHTRYMLDDEIDGMADQQAEHHGPPWASSTSTRTTQ